MKTGKFIKVDDLDLGADVISQGISFKGFDSSNPSKKKLLFPDTPETQCH